MGTDAYGKTKYAGETVICGKWKGAVAQRCVRTTLSPRTPNTQPEWLGWCSLGRGDSRQRPEAVYDSRALPIPRLSVPRVRLDRIGLPSKHRGYYDYRRDMVEHCVIALYFASCVSC